MGGTLLPRPFKNWSTYEGHSGIDYGVARNTPVPAQGHGVVTFAGYYSDRGGFAVHVDYGRGFIVGNYHTDNMQSVLVRAGDRVTPNQPLQLVGSLGKYSTGPHLHQDVWVNGSIQFPPKYWNYISQAEQDYMMATLDKDDKDWLKSVLVDAIWDETIGVKDNANSDYGRARDVLPRASSRALKAAQRSAEILIILKKSSGDIDVDVLLDAIHQMPAATIKALKAAL